MTRLTSVVPRDPSTLTITLPYNFDTSTLWGNILKGGILLTMFLGVCLLASLLTGHFVAALQLTIVGSLLLIGVRMAAKLEVGSIGTITRDSVNVHRGTLYGRSLPGPSGTYAISRFKAVATELVSSSPSQDIPGGKQRQWIYLVGDGATPRILVGDEDCDSQLGQELSILLNLPYEE